MILVYIRRLVGERTDSCCPINNDICHFLEMIFPYYKIGESLAFKKILRRILGSNNLYSRNKDLLG